MCYAARILRAAAHLSRLSTVEHPLLTSRFMHRSRALFALALLGGLVVFPATAFALAPTVGGFGTGTHTAGNTDLVQYPIGAPECSIEIPLTFSGLTNTTTTRYIDVWSATSASAGCQTGSVRVSTTSPVCKYVTSIPYTSGPTHTAMVTASTLFGGCSGTDQRTFFFFDTTSTQETSMNYTTYWTLTAAIDAVAPSAPVVEGAPAGDTVLQVSWNQSSFTDLGIAGHVNVYVDPTGCASTGDGGASSSTLVAGQVPPATAYSSPSASSPISVSTSGLGWGSGTYGQTAAIAIAAVDTAGNVSVLSNVVCATHVQVSGFFNAYCAEHHLSEAECAAYYRGCSVALPGRRTDWSALAIGMLVLGAFVLRRRSAR